MRRCTVCTHDQREDIDIALVRGVSIRQVEDTYGVGYNAAQRHKENHLSPALVRTMEAHTEGVERSVADHARALLADADAILRKAKDTGDIKLAVTAMENVRRTLRLIGDATGELDHSQPATVINLSTNAEYLEAERRIMEALLPYPEARRAVADALSGRPQPPAIEAVAHG